MCNCPDPVHEVGYLCDEEPYGVRNFVCNENLAPPRQKKGIARVEMDMRIHMRFPS
jgi:hypothetical protein